MPECGEQYFHLLESEDTTLGFAKMGWARTRTVWDPWVGFWCDGLDYAAWAVRCTAMMDIVSDKIDFVGSPSPPALGESIPEDMAATWAKLTSLPEAIPPPGDMQDCQADTLALVNLGKQWCCLLAYVVDYAEEQGWPVTVPAKPSQHPDAPRASSGGGMGFAGALAIIALLYFLTKSRSK